MAAWTLCEAPVLAAHGRRRGGGIEHVEALQGALRDNRSLLVLGPPGGGKTTLLREVARAHDALGRRVVVVDTSCEIAGRGACDPLALRQVRSGAARGGRPHDAAPQAGRPQQAAQGALKGLGVGAPRAVAGHAGGRAERHPRDLGGSVTADLGIGEGSRVSP